MRLHLTKDGPGFDAGEIVVTDQDNGWLVSTFNTCEVSAEEHEAIMRDLVAGYNACRDALAELDNDSSLNISPEVARAGQILRNALNA